MSPDKGMEPAAFVRSVEMLIARRRLRQALGGGYSSEAIMAIGSSPHISTTVLRAR
ncbi:MAG TPA: hypothetical protein VJU84_21590 [Pyrinomonadaceae bacterium]|nr:hypothetical protein [Pyrinomonadaceae bacterium]